MTPTRRIPGRGGWLLVRLPTLVDFVVLQYSWTGRVANPHVRILPHYRIARISRIATRFTLLLQPDCYGGVPFGTVIETFFPTLPEPLLLVPTPRWFVDCGRLVVLNRVRYVAVYPRLIVRYSLTVTLPGTLYLRR